METVNKLNRLTRQLVQEHGRAPTIEELSEKMELPEDKVLKALDVAKQPISLETPVGDDDDSIFDPSSVYGPDASNRSFCAGFGREACGG